MHCDCVRYELKRLRIVDELPQMYTMTPHIIYIMGVSGSGKTTIGKKLSFKTNLPFFDGDNFHSKSNIEKMRSGIALTDEDRIDWLESINTLAKKEMLSNGAIIACSALKEKYRSILSANITVPVKWVFLQGSYDLIAARMQSRKNHYMPPALLHSQFEILEPPTNALIMDIEEDADKIVETIISKLK